MHVVLFTFYMCIFVVVIICACMNFIVVFAVIAFTTLCTAVVQYTNTLIEFHITVAAFRVSRRPREMYCGHARLCVCVCVCVSVRGRMPTLLHGPRCNLGEW